MTIKCDWCKGDSKVIGRDYAYAIRKCNDCHHEWQADLIVGFTKNMKTTWASDIMHKMYETEYSHPAPITHSNWIYACMRRMRILNENDLKYKYSNWQMVKVGFRLLKGKLFKRKIK